MNLLVLKQENYDKLLVKQPELKTMIATIQDFSPELQRVRNNFGKTQTQFMDNMLTVSHATPLRNMRQIMAEIEKIQMALKENYFRYEKTKVKLKQKQYQLDSESDSFKRELLQISINQILSNLEDSEIYVSGAIRAMTNYIEQYKNIADKIMTEQGVTEFSELDLEAEEEKYHITKAFEQALCAARSRNGVIDEGNHIYFYQIGINGAAAQVEVIRFLEEEGKLIQSGTTPPHTMIIDFLNNMAGKFKGCSQQFANYKGMSTLTSAATVAPKLLK